MPPAHAGGQGSLAGRDSLQGEGRCPAFSPGHICGPFPVPCAVPQPQTWRKRGPSPGRAHLEWGVSGAGDGGTGSRAWRHNPGTKRVAMVMVLLGQVRATSQRRQCPDWVLQEGELVS